MEDETVAAGGSQSSALPLSWFIYASTIPLLPPTPPTPAFDWAPPLRGFKKHTATVNVRRSSKWRASTRDSSSCPAVAELTRRNTDCSSTGRSCEIEVTSPRRCGGGGRFNASGRLRSHDGQTRFLLAHSWFMIHSQQRIGFLSHCSSRLSAVRAKINNGAQAPPTPSPNWFAQWNPLIWNEKKMHFNGWGEKNEIKINNIFLSISSEWVGVGLLVSMDRKKVDLSCWWKEDGPCGGSPFFSSSKLQIFNKKNEPTSRGFNYPWKIERISKLSLITVMNFEWTPRVFSGLSGPFHEITSIWVFNFPRKRRF